MEKNQELHPSVQQFKEFMKQHPALIAEVKANRRSLQTIYEEWSILGPEHEQWQTYRSVKAEAAQEPVEEETASNSNSTASDTLGQVMGLIRRMNVQDLQNHLAQFSSVLANVQNVIQTFQRPSNQPSQKPQDHPFSFRRD
ncbi:YlbD family protein [Halalkalibacter oceani]|uniref:YlbD family protein n=1 Tax=Halalkalibacter oceani TaxID=1653776 RepID=A0A9X2DML9_9BACI|nr:YlbD family protein [Halalkalibacter oceani]MCM3713073.1 YlbD family protein [Halalkalibacter oceani]